jgi:hypothetical protein
MYRGSMSTRKMLAMRVRQMRRYDVNRLVPCTARNRQPETAARAAPPPQSFVALSLGESTAIVGIGSRFAEFRNGLPYIGSCLGNCTAGCKWRTEGAWWIAESAALVRAV